MAAGKWKDYDKAVLNRLKGELNMNATTNWKMALFQSSSNCNTLTAHEKYSDLTNEVANGLGYNTGGIALTNVVISRTGNVVKFDCDDAVWTAAGGSIAARFAVIYRDATDGTIVKPLAKVSLLDVTPADVTATDTNTFTVEIAAGGIAVDTGTNTD